MSSNTRPPSAHNNHTSAAYLSIAVALLRPQISWYGPRFALACRPPVPLSLGSTVQLEVRYCASDGTVQYAADTLIRGTILAVESIGTDSIEFVIFNDGPGHPFSYLLVPYLRAGFADLPSPLIYAAFLLRSYVHCTYWPENNVRTSVPDHNNIVQPTPVL